MGEVSLRMRGQWIRAQAVSFAEGDGTVIGLTCEADEVYINHYQTCSLRREDVALYTAPK